MIDLKLNKKGLGLHWHYYRARYFIFVIVAIFTANLLFSVTKPQVPPGKKVEIIIVSNAMNSEKADAWQQSLLAVLPPDQQEVDVESTPIIQGQESTVQQTIMARMSAGEGSIWIMTADYFASFAAGGAFKPLDDVIGSFHLPEGTNLASCKIKVQPDQDKPAVVQLCGIPLDKATGLSDMIPPVGMVMAFPSYSTVNYDNAAIIANYLLSMTQAPVPAATAVAAKQVNLIVADHAFAADQSADWQKGIDAALPADNGANVSALTYYTGRESYMADLIQARLERQAGGLCVVTSDVFVAMARKGYLMPLDSEVSSLNLPAGIDLAAGKEHRLQKDNTLGPEVLFGIPLDQILGLSGFFNPKGMVLAFLAQPSNQSPLNHAGAIAAANWILSKTK